MIAVTISSPCSRREFGHDALQCHIGAVTARSGTGVYSVDEWPIVLKSKHSRDVEQDAVDLVKTVWPGTLGIGCQQVIPLQVLRVLKFEV